MKKALIFFLLFMAFGAQAQVIPVGFMKQVVSGIPSIITSSISNLGPYSASIGGNITSVGTSNIIASGVCYSSSNQSPTLVDNVTTDGASAGTFTSSLTNLIKDTWYYVRAYATNSEGTAYGNLINFTSNGTVTSPYTGKIWMDRNLGATRKALSTADTDSYGDYYQWGRSNDGGALKTSIVVTTQLTNINVKSINAINVNPVTSQLNWITKTNGVAYDVQPWSSTDGGENNPCPAGFRVPSITEWGAELTGMSNDATLTIGITGKLNSSNLSGAYNSFLKIPTAGVMDNPISNLAGGKTYFWSSDRDNNTGAKQIRFTSTSTFLSAQGYNLRYSVRCIAK